MKLSPAKVHFNDTGTPCSSDYDDLYFSNENGIAETDYVFIQGNNLQDRWLKHQSAHYCIAETGFGTGLNFLYTAFLFDRFLQAHPQHILKNLYFISTEKHPIDIQLLTKILANFDQLENYSAQLLTDYPDNSQGVHRRHISTNICLDLHYGDAKTSLADVKTLQKGLVDAWFLDGFAPSKNPDMWHPKLFQEIARLSKPKATFATFTAAGIVKRGLMEQGFSITKRKGFGRKRDMLVGLFDKPVNLQTLSTKHRTNHAPYFYRHKINDAENDSVKQASSRLTVGIIGNGIAGAITALKLVQLGVSVNIFWRAKQSADGASGSPIGGFYPQLNAQMNTASQIQLQSFYYAHHFYQNLSRIAEFDHAFCGALQVAFNDNTKERLHKISQKQIWPNTVAQYVDPERASKLANIDLPYECLHLPNAGWISPHSMINACLKVAQNTGLLTLFNETELLKINSHHNNVINFEVQHNQSLKTVSHQCNALVFSTGFSSPDFSFPHIPLTLTRGQVELIASKPDLQPLQTLLCHKGYFTPAVNGMHAMGSTYKKEDTSCEVREAETLMNLSLQQGSLCQATWVAKLSDASQDDNSYARASVRCSTPDHQPVVGALPASKQAQELSELYKALPYFRYPIPSVQDNMFLLTGLGSRGLTTAPLMAEILVSQMLGRPLPLNGKLLDALMPNRFLVRNLIRQQRP
ncbi:bifunctional tRNA (5-methylaminomethyl-2-thiouridine)(34)-methyltransferase MnmD/FAD-dependent 5-carboxymethylaminomethyl-2-thiouridine(34) oxidoreductase MnmC [Glaciecola petra]|uniref:tRNA 5-methylaminomethyl-2-thiouridine biosynthesis bifunctional protein MnmC n=1 Tax=Glaciecola petra TaxID=3075602 RepID=A0ABU2ZMV4_9ALTE|nr:bifunctional tRNA (5-methylaminomethyl-2-thiouridine)(34)-methyltransferase MnmD/FAD-dependent 5-carboxymethylaminomethyl-2-thiouridine(34) oxidoreductase MnmC [Aestuariibacter sp. P117]MDT0593957.1 bifunctional tRNA (5-methylaminomethyl-2-thiouridine)(34)-methyltransferase MnmD/FAD-dependent 5-carboxymethylaminomethyl-2-thiouridine(34) oxidoreductase MnmC [Aestuariibacter sp. P117]